MTTELTKEQLAFLEECNLEFSERFTDADIEYKKIYDAGIPSPPIVYPWWVHGRGRRMNRDSPGNSRYNDNYRGRVHNYHQEDSRTSESPLAQSWYESRNDNNLNRNQVGSGRYSDTDRSRYREDDYSHKDYNRQQRYKPY